MFKTKRSLLNSSIAISFAVLGVQAQAETLELQAESFANSGGTYSDGQPNPVTIYNVNGQGAINFVNAGDYVDYNINALGGEYDIEYFVGTGVTSGPNIEVLVDVNGTWQSQGSVAVPYGSWDDFQSLTPSHTVTLPVGTSTVRLLAVGSTWQWNLESFRLTQVSPVEPVGDADNDGVNDNQDLCPNSPSGVTVDNNGCQITGGTDPGGESFVIQMEAFDSTGSDDSRAKGVIIGERGYPQDKHTVVDSVQTTDWVDYSINFPSSANYSVSMLASGQTDHATAVLYLDGTEINEVPVHTGSQADFANFQLAGSVYIASGTHTIRVQAQSSTGEFSWLWFGDALTFTNLDSDGGNGGEATQDADNDGVLDSSDSCPNTPTGEPADVTGCSASQLDDDNDGVSNNVDQCPNTVAGTEVDADGCEVIFADADNDGIEDSQDFCPNTPAGEAVNNSGCGASQLDADNDGVTNNIDQCPNTPAGTQVDASGCETDNGGEPGDSYYHNGQGLLFGRVDGATNFLGEEGYVANPDNYDVTTDLLETDDAIRANSTEVFRGEIYDADGHIAFYEHIDDSVRLYIDGQLVLSNDSWENSSQTTDLNLTPGWHNFELRLGNADGGSGAVSGIGFGIDVDGGTNFVHPSNLSPSMFRASGQVVVDPILPPSGGIYIQLEDFDETGTVGRVASDPNDGFVKGDSNVGWVTNGDWGKYHNVFLEAGTYRAFITVSTPAGGSYGARVDIDGEPFAWGYFDSTGGWDIAAEYELYGGHLVVESTGNHTLHVEAVGGSDWQWSGDLVRLAKVSDSAVKQPRVYNPNEHIVAEIQGPATGLQYLKTPVEIPLANKVLKSDVWYTYPQNRNLVVDGDTPYADFGATGAFWGHPPEHDFYDDTVIMDWAVNVVDDFQSEGFEYTARGEFDWGYGWFTEFTTNPQPHYVQTLDGRNVRMTFMGYLSHDGYNNNWLSNHSPAFVPFMKSQVDQILKANPDKLMFDTQTNSTRSTDMRTFGGDFSPYAMENFRVWLLKKYSNAQLVSMGINDITSFDYGAYLRAQGITHTDWSNAGDTISGNIPMMEDFIYFNRDVWNQKFAEVLEYIRQQRPNIEIGASTHLFESRGYIFNENITFLSGELNLGARTSISELPTNILVHLKGAQAVDKTLAYFPYPWEFDELRIQNAPRFGRGWVAQAYAYGGLFSIPANVWVGGEVFTWSPGADNYRDIYQFVRAQANLLDGYTSYAKAGYVHAMFSSMKAGFIDGGNQVQSSVKILTEDNINFDMLVFGDAGYPVVPRQADFDKFEYIFYDGDLNYLTAEQQAVLDAQGSKVKHIGQRGTIAGLQINVSINGSVSNETVSAVSRIHETDSTAPYVVHLINRPFAGGVTPILNNVEVAIPASYFPQGVTSAKLHLPDGSSSTVAVSTNANGDTVVSVSNLEVWGILELAH
uniref:Alpha-agarase n=1 Tax=Alteromonas agarilytica TaxID=105692 RepID=AAGAR_ALTAG|nr:RecName: Full=Alpha-agarase; Flags: Precursor [Alteromonas agarilytica]AAF26838.1 alpha-agarase precursor [Alteromonas agarilytica]